MREWVLAFVQRDLAILENTERGGLLGGRVGSKQLRERDDLGTFVLGLGDLPVNGIGLFLRT